jgi:hypothetical protein
MSSVGGAVATNWDEVVVLVGVRRWDGRASTLERLALGLSEHVAVLVVLPGPTPMTSDGDGGVQIVGPRLAHVLAPGMIGGRWASAFRFDAALVRRTVRRSLAELGSPRVLAVVVSSSLPTLGSVGEDVRVQVVADDLLDGWAVPPSRVPKLERALHRGLSDADIVVAGSPAIAAVLGEGDVDPEVVPDGLADEVYDSAAAHRARRTGPRSASPAVGFVGDLAGDLDLDALDAVAAAGHDVLLIGRGPRGAVPPALARVLRRSNVEWVGPRRVDELAGLVARCRVGVVPLVDSPYTRARLPLDSLAHLASGQPLVGTVCEPLRWLRGGGPIGPRHREEEPVRLDDRDVAIADDAGGVAALVAARLEAPADPLAEDRRRRFAANHRRSVRAAHLASVLGIRTPDAVGASR